MQLTKSRANLMICVSLGHAWNSARVRSSPSLVPRPAASSVRGYGPGYEYDSMRANMRATETQTTYTYGCAIGFIWFEGKPTFTLVWRLCNGLRITMNFNGTCLSRHFVITQILPRLTLCLGWLFM
jgi:hypothetical protein